MKPSRSSLIRIAAAAVLTIAASVATGWWLYWSEDPLIGPDVSGFPVKGVDVSAHNGVVDFRRLRDAEGIGFVLIKATEGAQWQDRRFLRNFREAHEAGMKVGIYHFFRFDVDPELQALNVIATLRGLEPDMPVAIDVEEWTNPDDIHPDTVAMRVSRMMQLLRERGINSLVYTNKRGHSRIVSRIPSEKPLVLWLCSLGSDIPPHRLSIWQYSHRGRLSGVDGKIDLNVFAGDSAGWRTWLSDNTFRIK